MTVSVTSVLDRVGIILNDVANVTWPRLERVMWINDGQRELIAFKPEANIKTVSHPLVAGARQALPADALALVELRQNTAGPVILPCDRAMLDAFMPGWMTAAASAAVRNYMPDPASPKRFLVYPPQPASTSYVLISYVAYPVTVAETGTNTNLDVLDLYAERILNYVLYRAYSKDTEFADAAARASAHYQLFKGE